MDSNHKMDVFGTGGERGSSVLKLEGIFLPNTLVVTW